MDKPLQEISGRLSEPTVYVLVSLSEGPKHGYEIMADVEAVSGEPLGAGTLYAVLARLERRGLIEGSRAPGATPAVPTDRGGGRRIAGSTWLGSPGSCRPAGADSGWARHEPAHRPVSKGMASTLRGGAPRRPVHPAADHPRPRRPGQGCVRREAAPRARSVPAGRPGARGTRHRDRPTAAVVGIPGDDVHGDHGHVRVLPRGRAPPESGRSFGARFQEVLLVAGSVSLGATLWRTRAGLDGRVSGFLARFGAVIMMSAVLVGAAPACHP